MTGGFLHAANPLHIPLQHVHPVLARADAHRRSATPASLALYFTSLLAGSFGALLFSPAHQGTVGASGAVFGLMAAAFVMQHARGINPWQSGVGPIILLNLALGFIIPNVSIGGHIGGLVGGALVALAFERVPAVRRSSAAMLGSCALIAVVAVVGAIAVADAKTDALQSQSLQGLIGLFT